MLSRTPSCKKAKFTESSLFNTQPSVAFSTAVNQCTGPLRKQSRLAQQGQKNTFQVLQTLRLADFDPLCCFRYFCGLLVVIPREARLINLSDRAGPSGAKPREFERKIYFLLGPSVARLINLSGRAGPSGAKPREFERNIYIYIYIYIYI